jgi:acetyl-CoA carboxylase beta subunit
MNAMARRDIVAPLAGSVVAVLVEGGQTVRRGEVLAIVEAMKMEHEVRSAEDGEVVGVRVHAGDLVAEGEVLLGVAPVAAAGAAMATAPAAAPPAAVRPDLHELREREAWLDDARRPEAVGRRHALGLRTARENIADLCDPGSFVEYGALAIAAQRSRRSHDDLVRHTPADGMVSGIGRIDAAALGTERSRAVVLAYDVTVLAGTQGMRNHQKTDRMLGIAAEQALPVVLFAEGGGGRPGDVDMPIVAGLHVPTFASFARLSGRVPLIGIAAGRCFARNAALLGCCDVVIAVRGSSIGMGGPAMVEGGGLGTFRPEEIGPSDVQTRSGVIDVLVESEAEAVAVARRLLAIFQAGTAEWRAADPAAAARGPAGEPRARLRHPRRARGDPRRRLGARAARRLRPRHGDGAGAHRGPRRRRHRQQPGPPRRRHRRRGR